MPVARKQQQPAARKQAAPPKVLYQYKTTTTKSVPKVAVRQRGQFVGPFGRYLTFQGDNQPLVLRQFNEAAPEQRFRFITNDAASGLYQVKWFDPVTKISYQLYGMPGEDSALYAGKRPPTNASTTISIRSASGQGMSNPVTLATYVEDEELYRWTGTQKYTVSLTLPVASNTHQLWNITPPLPVSQTVINANSSESESSDVEDSDADSSSEDHDEEVNDGFDSEPELEETVEKDIEDSSSVKPILNNNKDESIVDRAVKKAAASNKRKVMKDNNIEPAFFSPKRPQIRMSKAAGGLLAAFLGGSSLSSEPDVNRIARAARRTNRH